MHADLSLSLSHTHTLSLSLSLMHTNYEVADGDRHHNAVLVDVSKSHSY